ncbi:MAG: hypothetical protein WBV22_01660, partial [Anaerolineaceae bacterium]
TATTVQDRAEDIFADMSAVWTANDSLLGGWPQSAIQWWLASANNTWTSNPYTVVTVLGGLGCVPWADTNGAQTIGNELRDFNMVGLAIRWPNGVSVYGCNGGHAITGWGDENPSMNPLTANPAEIHVTDSDTDAGGDVQAYVYDAYTNPNPSGDDEGNGWYFNYGNSNNHAYIINAVTLSPTSGVYGVNTVRVLGSYKILQNLEQEASDLHYLVGTDVDILTYRTWLDWEGTPSITENQPRRELTVDWDFSKFKMIPQNTWVTISTEFIEPYWNSIRYRNVYFTYPDMRGSLLPDLAWEIETPVIDRAELIPSVTGGYVIGSFDIATEKSPDIPIARYRLVHQYLYNQSPEFHTFTVSGSPGFVISDLLFGHSYGYPTEEELWRFENWMNKQGETVSLGTEPVKITIDWKGLLPYPEGLK